jgi:hypothetical protein
MGNNMKVLCSFTPCQRLLVKMSHDKCVAYSDILLYTCMRPNKSTREENKSISDKKWTFTNILARYSLQNKNT